jgi:hypothetical protein
MPPGASALVCGSPKAVARGHVSQTKRRYLGVPGAAIRALSRGAVARRTFLRGWAGRRARGAAQVRGARRRGRAWPRRGRSWRGGALPAIVPGGIGSAASRADSPSRSPSWRGGKPREVGFGRGGGREPGGLGVGWSKGRPEIRSGRRISIERSHEAHYLHRPRGRGAAGARIERSRIGRGRRSPRPRLLVGPSPGGAFHAPAAG